MSLPGDRGPILWWNLSVLETGVRTAKKAGAAGVNSPNGWHVGMVENWQLQ